MPLASGEVFAAYTILRLLGAGGMGEVYLVEHPRLPRREALKVLPAGVSADPLYRKRFEREADLVAGLWHPHIVEIHDRGEHNGQLWITMDYVDGTDAARLLADRYANGMPPADVIEVVSAIADALDYAHERNLLHRDVKPANILIAGDDTGRRRILLTDFGIARDTNETSTLTATNIAIGTIDYAAPEQLMGLPLDGRADQYALACTAFRLLTGRAPFTASNPAVVIGNHLSSPVPRLGSVRPDLSAFDDIFARAMAKQPAQRFGSCRDFATALSHRHAQLAATQPATRYAYQAPLPPTWPHTAPQTASRGPRRTAMLVTIGVAVLVAVGLVAFLGSRMEQQLSQDKSISSTSVAALPKSSYSPPATSAASSPTGDLGLSTPISTPACNGKGIVIVGSVTTPGLYAAGVQRMLTAHPGAFYLRTDQSCPSLRQKTTAGDPIYAVFYLGGTTRAEVCAVVRRAGGDAYGKWLDTSTDPGYIIPC